MPKDGLNRTTRYMSSRSRAKGFDGYTPVPAGHFDHPNLLTRGTYHVFGPEPNLDTAKYLDAWKDRDDLLIVCDTGIFEDNAPEELWRELTRVPGRLVLTPKVREELTDWIGRRPTHLLANVLDPASGLADLVEPSQWPRSEYLSYWHYIALLGTRKRIHRLFCQVFVREHGRPPTTEADISQINARLQRELGERGYLFAKKGAAHPNADEDYCDEEVVVVAMLMALKTGRESIILTKDMDLFDQFFRLQYLVSSHYRATLIAKDYADNPGRYRRHPLPQSKGWDEVFNTACPESYLVERSENLPNEVLPPAYDFLAVQCHVHGREFNAIAFGAEREMWETIETKGKHDGANTSLLLPRNCHLVFPNLGPDPHGYHGPAFVIAEDQYLTAPATGQRIPRLELGQGFMNIERFKILQEEK